MNFKIYSFGCKVNQYESQYMRELMEENGFLYNEDDSMCDIFIVNSCAVTAISESKCRRFLSRLRRVNPQSIIVLTGCVSQAFPRKYENFTCCDVVLGNTERTSVLTAIKEFIETGQQILRVNEHNRKCGEFENYSIRSFSERSRAYIKIEDGCDRFCSYCIIAYARGRVRFKSLEVLRKEVSDLSAKGFREIVLVGINLSRYGTDIGYNICDAVEAVADSEGVERIRLGSLEPELLTEDILSRLSKCEKFCPQFHLSLQSGSDGTLKRMNRHYTSSEYMEIVNNIRSKFNNPGFTTDVMVGFPGEDEKEFSESLSFVEAVGFAKVHVFPYSRRSGTVADRMPMQLTKSVKEERARIMSEIAERKRQEFLLSQVGLTTTIIIEQEVSQGVYEGYTPNYTPVRVSLNSDMYKGECLTVRILEAHDDYCTAEVISS